MWIRESACCNFGLHWCSFVYGGPQPASYCARKNVQKTKVMQKVAGLPKAIESFYSCSTTLHTQARLTFKQTSLAYLFIRLQHAGDYIWGAQMWFCSPSDEANANERLRSVRQNTSRVCGKIRSLRAEWCKQCLGTGKCFECVLSWGVFYSQCGETN